MGTYNRQEKTLLNNKPVYKHEERNAFLYFMDVTHGVTDEGTLVTKGWMARFLIIIN